jgi:hypothetical protein
MTFKWGSHLKWQAVGRTFGVQSLRSGDQPAWGVAWMAVVGPEVLLSRLPKTGNYTQVQGAGAAHQWRGQPNGGKAALNGIGQDVDGVWRMHTSLAVLGTTGFLSFRPGDTKHSKLCAKGSCSHGVTGLRLG